MDQKAYILNKFIILVLYMAFETLNRNINSGRCNLFLMPKKI